MYCNKIFTYVEYWAGVRRRRGSFFGIEVDHDELGDVLHMVGEAKVDSHSMWRLLEWQNGTGEIKEITLLVSLDGKHIIVADRHHIDHVADPGMSIALNPEGNGIYGSVEGKLRPFLDRWVVEEPEIGFILGYKPKTDMTIPDRVLAEKVTKRVTGEQLDAQVRLAFVEAENATDDALFWAYLVNSLNPKKAENNYFIYEEIAVRTSGDKSIDPFFFKLSEMSLAEIEARIRRAKRALKAFWRKFPNAHEVNDAAIHSYLKGLPNDRFAELAMAAFYSAPEYGVREKHLIMEYESRMVAANDQHL